MVKSIMQDQLKCDAKKYVPWNDTRALASMIKKKEQNSFHEIAGWSWMHVQFWRVANWHYDEKSCYANNVPVYDDNVAQCYRNVKKINRFGAWWLCKTMCWRQLKWHTDPCMLATTDGKTASYAHGGSLVECIKFHSFHFTIFNQCWCNLNMNMNYKSPTFAKMKCE